MTAAAAPHSSFEEVIIDFVRTPISPGPRTPVALLSREEKAAELQRVQRRRAIDAAYEAELILGLADESPDDDDPPPGHPGAKRSWGPNADLPGVSEFFTAELALVLNVGRATAARRARRAWTWRANLPATRAALAAGALDEARAQDLAEVLEHASPDAARAIEAELLPAAAGLSRYELRKRALALLLERDAEAVDKRRTQAKKSADVRTYPSELDGMSTLAADLPTDEAAAAYDLIDQLAKMLKADGDPRPIGQLRAEVLSALIRRPADHGLPGVRANLTVVAALAAVAGTSAVAGEVNGHPITAAHLRELLARIGALGLQAPAGGGLTFALTDPDGRLLATLTPAELRRLARRGCPTHPGGECACPVLGPPPPTAAYTPTAGQRAFITTRDRTCRFPHCAQRVGWADHDHVIPHARGGETTCTNLCCLCRSHHRLKTFARGWRFRMDPDGTLHVTTPSGVTRTTRPPGLRPPPPEQPEPDQPPAEPADDPPPF